MKAEVRDQTGSTTDRQSINCMRSSELTDNTVALLCSNVFEF